jgi:hypothetical protein
MEKRFLWGPMFMTYIPLVWHVEFILTFVQNLLCYVLYWDQTLLLPIKTVYLEIVLGIN